MKNGDISSGSAKDTASGRADSGADEHAVGVPASGWLDRLALRTQLADVPKGALRPRLPYAFEAMKLATEDARMPSSSTQSGAAMEWRQPQHEPMRGGVPRADEDSDGLSGAPRARDGAAGGYHETRAGKPSDAARAVQSRDLMRTDDRAHDPALRPSLWEHPLQAPIASMQHAAGQSADSAAPRAAGQDSRARATETTSLQPMRTSRAGNDFPRKPTLTARTQQPASDQPRQVLRSGSGLRAPLPAKQSADSTQELTIDIHIGRIDVRALAAPSASPVAAQATPSQRGGDALNTYLMRRARGARS